MSQLLIVIPISFEKTTLEDDIPALVILLKTHLDFLGFRSKLLSFCVLTRLYFFGTETSKSILFKTRLFPNFLLLTLDKLISYYRD